MPAKSTIRIGISGWRYPQWRGVFYPKGVRQADELHYASRQLNFNEINGTFYSLQRPSSFKAWYAATPDDFVFAVKGPQYITHIRRLREITQPLKNFFASGVLALGKKLGPMLWQTPPNFKFDAELLTAFFEQLPRDTQAAAELARGHDDFLKKEQVLLDCDVDQPLRHVIEVRNPSFETPEFISLVRKHRIAVVAASATGKWPLIEDVTADFMYLRLHGAEELYASGYSDEDIDRWAAKIRAWNIGQEPADARRLAEPIKKKVKLRDVFCVFDNTMKDRAPANSIRLSKQLGLLAGKDRAEQWPDEEAADGGGKTMKKLTKKKQA